MVKKISTVRKFSTKYQHSKNEFRKNNICSENTLRRKHQHSKNEFSKTNLPRANENGDGKHKRQSFDDDHRGVAELLFQQKVPRDLRAVSRDLSVPNIRSVRTSQDKVFSQQSVGIL